jgi:hypothetical protein
MGRVYRVDSRRRTRPPQPKSPHSQVEHHPQLSNPPLNRVKANEPRSLPSDCTGWFVCRTHCAGRLLWMAFTRQMTGLGVVRQARHS